MGCSTVIPKAPKRGATAPPAANAAQAPVFEGEESCLRPQEWRPRFQDGCPSCQELCPGIQDNSSSLSAIVSTDEMPKAAAMMSNVARVMLPSIRSPNSSSTRRLIPPVWPSRSSIAARRRTLATVASGALRTTAREAGEDRADASNWWWGSAPLVRMNSGRSMKIEVHAPF